MSDYLKTTTDANDLDTITRNKLSIFETADLARALQGS